MCTLAYQLLLQNAQLGNRLTASDIALLSFANLKLSQSSHLLDLNLP
jgi:hypothetical protein